MVEASNDFINSENVQMAKNVLLQSADGTAVSTLKLGKKEKKKKIQLLNSWIFKHNFKRAAREQMC